MGAAVGVFWDRGKSFDLISLGGVLSEYAVRVTRHMLMRVFERTWTRLILPTHCYPVGLLTTAWSTV